MDGKKTPLTQEAFDRLRKELGYLEGEGRKKIVDAIATARSHGDLAENAEYHAARDEQAQAEAKIRKIRHMLQTAEIVTASDDGVAAPGKVVTIRYEGDDAAETYLLGVREETSEHDVLTPESPIGSALMGRKAGESVVAHVPAGDLRVEIVEVRSP